MTIQNIVEYSIKFGIRYVPNLIPPLVHIVTGITHEELYPVRFLSLKRFGYAFNFYTAFHCTRRECIA